MPFVLDDNVALYMETDADGVRRSNDMAAEKVRERSADKILGVSAQTVKTPRCWRNAMARIYLGIGRRVVRDKEGRCKRREL